MHTEFLSFLRFNTLSHFKTDAFSDSLRAIFHHNGAGLGRVPAGCLILRGNTRAPAGSF